MESEEGDRYEQLSFILGAAGSLSQHFFVGGRSTLKCGAETPSNASMFVSPGALGCFDFITSLTTQFRQGTDLFIPRAIIYKLTASELDRSVFNQPTLPENSELRTYFPPWSESERSWVLVICQRQNIPLENGSLASLSGLLHAGFPPILLPLGFLR